MGRLGTLKPYLALGIGGNYLYFSRFTQTHQVHLCWGRVLNDDHGPNEVTSDLATGALDG